MKKTNLTAGELIVEQAQKSKTDVKIPLKQLAKDITDNNYLPQLKDAFIKGKRKFFNRWPWYIQVLRVPQTALSYTEIIDSIPHTITPLKLTFELKYNCPTPNYEQDVYIYNHEIDDIELLWSVPNKETCLMYIENQAIIHPEEYPILQQVLAFKNGDLFKKMKELNDERMDSNILNSTDMHKVAKIIHH